MLADLREQFNSEFDQLLVVDRERIALAPKVQTDLAGAVRGHSAGELFEGLDHIDPELDEWLRVEREKWEREMPVARARAPAADPSRIPLQGWVLAFLTVLAATTAALLYFR